MDGDSYMLIVIWKAISSLWLLVSVVALSML